MAILTYEDLMSGEYDTDGPEILGKSKIGKKIKARFKRAKKTVRGQFKLYKQRRKVRKSKTLTKAQKRQQVRALSKKIRQGRRKIIKGAIKGALLPGLAPLAKVSPTMQAVGAAKLIKKRRAAKRARIAAAKKRATGIPVVVKEPISKPIYEPDTEPGIKYTEPVNDPVYEPDIEPGYNEPMDQELEEQEEKKKAPGWLLPVAGGLGALLMFL